MEKKIDYKNIAKLAYDDMCINIYKYASDTEEGFVYKNICNEIYSILEESEAEKYCAQVSDIFRFTWYYHLNVKLFPFEKYLEEVMEHLDKYTKERTNDEYLQELVSYILYK
jgi:hypothetical protein